MPMMPGLVKIVDQPLYDTVRIPTRKNSEVRLFEIPISKGKERIQTNLYDSGQLPAPQEMTVFRISGMFIRDGKLTSPFTDRIWTESVLEFWIGSLSCLQGPAWMFAHPISLFGTTEFAKRLSRGAKEEIFRLVVRPLTRPLTIGQRETFHLDLRIDGKQDADLKFVACLEGELLRGVM